MGDLKKSRTPGADLRECRYCKCYPSLKNMSKISEIIMISLFISFENLHNKSRRKNNGSMECEQPRERLLGGRETLVGGVGVRMAFRPTPPIPPRLFNRCQQIKRERITRYYLIRLFAVSTNFLQPLTPLLK